MLAGRDDPCARPEFTGLDAWIGSWSVGSGDAAAASSIERLGAGCAVFESYREGDYSGRSLNYVDPQDGRWHQVWLDSAGALSDFEGTARAPGGVDFEGFTRRAGGERVLRRMSVVPEGEGVRQRSWLSRDGGVTWQDHYSLAYRRDVHDSLAGPCQAPAAPDAERRARASAEAVVAADNASNLAGVLASYARDAVLLPPGDVPVAGADRIRARYERLFAGFRPAIDGRIAQVCVAGPVALVQGHNGGRLVGKDGAPSRAIDDDYWMVLRDDGSGFRISVLAWRPARPASPAPAARRP